MKFVFTLTDEEAKAVNSYRCAVDAGADMVKNGKALSSSVMQVGGCMSRSCSDNAAKAKAGSPPPSGTPARGGDGKGGGS
jgi:hypothetical protein